VLQATMMHQSGGEVVSLQLTAMTIQVMHVQHSKTSVKPVSKLHTCTDQSKQGIATTRPHEIVHLNAGFGTASRTGASNKDQAYTLASNRLTDRDRDHMRQSYGILHCNTLWTPLPRFPRCKPGLPVTDILQRP
jgi:hypothetical protein